MKKQFWSICLLIIMLPSSVFAQIIDNDGVNTWIIGHGLKQKILEVIPEPPPEKFKSAAPKPEPAPPAPEPLPEITCPQPKTQLQVVYENKYFVFAPENDFSTTLRKSKNPSFSQYFKKEDSLLDFFLKLSFLVSILNDDILF